MDEQADRRRRNRVQGSFNQGGRGRGSTSSRRPVNYQARSSLDGAMERDSSSRSASASETEQPRPPRRSMPPFNTRNPSEKAFVYRETNQVFREKPEIKTIGTEGKHTLSGGPNGESWIYFDPKFLDEHMEQDAFDTLLNDIKWESTSIIIAGEIHKVPRLVKWFGPLPYSYSSVTLEANNEWHPAVLRILEAVQERLKCEFNSVLLNLYEHEKHSVDWHSDDELGMGVHPTIASISLGEARKFELRKKPPPDSERNFEYMQHVNMYLPGGSLVVMDGETQLDWQHRIPKEYHSRKPRINLTFRTIYSTT